MRSIVDMPVRVHRITSMGMIMGINVGVNIVICGYVRLSIVVWISVVLHHAMTDAAHIQHFA